MRLWGIIIAGMLILIMRPFALADPPDWKLQDWLLVNQVYLLRADGSGRTNLRQASAPDYFTSLRDNGIIEEPDSWEWASDGALLLHWDFVRFGTPPDILLALNQILTSDGTVIPVRNLFDNPLPFQRIYDNPVPFGAVSPDGNWRVVAVPGFDEQTVSATSSDVTIRLYGPGIETTLYEHTFESGYNLVEKISWSPDNAYFAYGITNRGTGKNSQVYVVDVREATLPGYTPSEEGASNGRSPSWSPDGKYIAFICNLSGSAGNICMISPDGTHEQTLFPNLPDVIDIAWLPDSSQLTWVTVDGAIYAMDADCLADDSCQPDNVHSYDYAQAVGMLTPHDGYVAYSCYRRDTGNEVCILDMKNGTVWQITSGAGQIYHLAWRPQP